MTSVGEVSFITVLKRVTLKFSILSKKYLGFGVLLLSQLACYLKLDLSASIGLNAIISILSHWIKFNIIEDYLIDRKILHDITGKYTRSL